MSKHLLIENLRKKLPELIARKELSMFLGGIISVKTIANLDSKGKGPKNKMRFGKRTVFYSKEAVLDWVESNIADFSGS